MLLKRNKTKELNYRTMTIRAENGAPASLDEKTRSVEIIGTTEDPARVFDWSMGEIVDEVLLMSGVMLPKSKKLPLLDSHQRDDTATVIGSFRNIKTEKDMLIGRAFFSEVPKADEAYTKVKEGHLDAFSIGYRPVETIKVDPGEETTIEGKTYKGPMLIRTKWRPKEQSILAIGADERATAREYINNQNQKKGYKMDEKFRQFLISKGMPKEYTDEQALEFAATLEIKSEPGDDSGDGQRTDPAPDPQTTEPTAIDPEVIRAAVAEDRQRAAEIRAIGNETNLTDEAESHVERGSSVDVARADLFRRFMDAQKSNPVHMGPAVIEKDERDKFKAAAQDALLLRAGGDFLPEKPVDGATELIGYSLKELARLSLQKAGLDYGGRTVDMIGRALNLKATTTGDLPYILANVANKSLYMGFDQAEETWPVWCGTGSVPDFKMNSLPRLGEADDLDEIPESGQYQYGSAAEAKEEFKIATYGKIWAITRQTIVNDDLAALTAIPQMHGEAAARKIGDVVYAVLTANSAMGDGIALFHASHNNIGTGGDAGAPGVDTVGHGEYLMGTQKDLKGLSRLNIMPAYYIGPKKLKTASEVFFRSERYVDADTSATRDNIYYNTLTMVHESRLDDDSLVKWYLAGRMGRTVNVYFLDGVQRPYMESRLGWTVDGTEQKVRIDAGAKAVDYMALYLNEGA